MLQSRITALEVDVKKLAIIAVTALLSLSANGADWQTVSKDDSGSYLVDIDSIYHIGNYTTAYIRYKLNEPRNVYDTPHDEVEYLREFICDSPIKSRVLSIVVRANGETIDASSVNNKWSFAHPDTVGQTISDFVCSH